MANKPKKNVWKKGFITRMVVIAAIHVLATIGLIVYICGGSIVLFSPPDATLEGTQKTISTVVWVLTQPAHNIWNTGVLDSVPVFMNWIFFGANSLLWGLILSFLLGVVFKTNKPKNRKKL